MHISAILTTYRRFKKCCRAIDAIQRQTSPVQEVIVIDNASPEPEYTTLHELYAGAPVPVNVVRLSRGTHTQAPFSCDDGTVISYSSRDTANVGIRLARGDWFAFCHDDDEWMPHRIERQRYFLEQLPTAMLIGSAHLGRTENGDLFNYPLLTAVELTEVIEDVTPVLMNHGHMAVSSLLVSRRLVEKIGWWQDWCPDSDGERMRKLAAADWDFQRRASRVTPVLRVGEPLTYYEVGNKKWEGHMGYNQ